METLANRSLIVAMTCLTVGMPCIVAAFFHHPLIAVAQAVMAVAGIATIVNCVAVIRMERQMRND